MIDLTAHQLIGQSEKQTSSCNQIDPNRGQYHVLEPLLLFDEYKCTEYELTIVSDKSSHNRPHYGHMCIWIKHALVQVLPV